QRAAPWGLRSRRDPRSRLPAWQRHRRPRTPDFRSGLLHNVAKMAGIALPRRRNWARNPPVRLLAYAAKTGLREKSSMTRNETFCVTVCLDEALRGPGREIPPGKKK